VRMVRMLLSALVVGAVALAPVATAFAAAHATAPASALDAPNAGLNAGRDAGMADCHRSSAGPTRESKGGHCPDCDDKGNCNAACILKCFSPAGDVRPLARAAAPVAVRLDIVGTMMPPDWSSKPPPPPPRA